MILPTNLTAEEIYGAAAAAGARPDPLLTISQWADRYRWLSQRASAEHGRWRTERTPYLREIMDCLSPSSLIERVAFMKGAQIGGTECGNNWMGYVIHQAPGPMMSVQPTVEMAKRNSKQRIEPLIEESDVLRKLVRDPRSRDSGNTVLSKDFPGGVLVMTGANSAVGLRSMAARYLFLDEVDAYPGDVEGEGDPITLAMARTRTFARRKVFLVSTPKITGMSRIEAAYEESDQRKYWVADTNRPVRSKDDVVLDNVLAALEPHMGVKRIVHHYVVLENPEETLAQFDPAVQCQVVVDVIICGSVIQVDIPTVIAPKPVVAQDGRFHRVQTRKLAVCARGDRVRIQVLQLPVAVAPPGVERTVVAGFLDRVEHVVVFDDVPAPGALGYVDAGSRHVVDGTMPHGNVLGHRNFHRSGLLLHAAGALDQRILQQAFGRIARACPLFS
jgi:hypothetical protein